MSVDAEVGAIHSKLIRILDGTRHDDDVPELVSALAKMPITLNTLVETKIGMTLNDLRRKTANEQIAKQCRELIKAWKSMIAKNTDSDGVKKKERQDSNGSDAVNNNRASSSQMKKNSVTTTAAPKRSEFFPPPHIRSDQVRANAVNMILNALQSGELPDGTLDTEDLALRIEYTLHSNTTVAKYAAAVRSRVFNLRDKKNVALRENVLTGVVKPEKFAVMTSEEMASDEIRSLRDKFNQEALREHQMSVQQGTPSEMFKCGKCGKKNCTYTQLQTRSSDEPMTTFVFCLECGNRWKFC